MSHVYAHAKLQQVQELLCQRLRGQVRELRVTVRDTNIVLQGIAASYYAKQVAQTLVLDFLGVVALANEIEVQRLVRPAESDTDETT